MCVFQLNGTHSGRTAVHHVRRSRAIRVFMHDAWRMFDVAPGRAFKAHLHRQELRNSWKTACADTIGGWALGGRAFACAASTIVSTTIRSCLTRRWYLRPGGSSSLREGRRAEVSVDPCSRRLGSRGAVGRSSVCVRRWIRRLVARECAYFSCRKLLRTSDVRISAEIR